MRKLGFIAAVVFLAAGSNAEQKADNAAEEPIEEEVESVVQNATYGAEIDGSSAKPASGLLAELQASEIDSIQTTVVGTIEKGDMIVASSITGVGTASDDPRLGSVIGKALENYNSDSVGVIEVVVGRQ